MTDRHPLGPISALLFLAAAIAAAIATYRRPAWGIALLVASDPFSFHRDIFRTTVTLPKAVLVGVLIGLAARRLSLKPLLLPQARALTFGAIAICLATALSAIPGIYIDAVARETLKAVQYLALFAGCVIAWVADSDESTFKVVLSATVLLVCVEALAQEWIGAPSAVAIGGHVIPRIAGPLEGPNQLAGYLVLVLPLLVAYAIAERDYTTLFPAVLAFAVLMLTLSRAGIAAGFVSLAVPALGLRGINRRIGLALIGGLTLAGVAAVAAVGGLARVTSTEQFNAPSGLATRAQLWAAAIQLWRTSPLLGIGAGNFELRLASVGLPGVQTHPNDAYLQALTEGGIPLFAAVLWTQGAAIWTFAVSGLRAPLVLGALAASCGFAVHQVFDSMAFNVKVGSMWWIVLGCAVGSVIVTKQRRPEGDGRQSASAY